MTNMLMSHTQKMTNKPGEDFPYAIYAWKYICVYIYVYVISN